jgi:hypothetical protein
MMALLKKHCVAMPNTIDLAGRRSVFFVEKVYKPLRLLLKLVKFHPVPAKVCRLRNSFVPNLSSLASEMLVRGEASETMNDSSKHHTLD